MNGTTNGVNGHHEEPVPLPSAKSFEVSDVISIQPPLSRRGHGPALVLLVPAGADLTSHEKTLDPPPLQKWAEEGYAVAQISVSEDNETRLANHLRTAVDALGKLAECDSVERTGLISYNALITHEGAKAIDSCSEVVAVITHGSHTFNSTKPQQRHLPEPHTKVVDAQDGAQVAFYNYSGAGSFFSIPAHDDFRSASAAVAHTRCLTFLKPLTNGPFFDLEAIWDEHTQYEFGERAVEKTMGTMVQEPYVNHIPTMTGGIGRERLTNFYRHHFVFNNPADTALELVSRTVGIDRVIDEFIFSFTHDKEIDWLAPGIPPTGKFVALPFTSVVNIRGDRLYHEHIGWDGATLLRQLGLLPEYLPFPYELPDGRKPAPGKRFEYQVPAAGVETAKKLLDERSVPSNELFNCAIREVDL